MPSSVLNFRFDYSRYSVLKIKENFQKAGSKLIKESEDEEGGDSVVRHLMYIVYIYLFSYR